MCCTVSFLTKVDLRKLHVANKGWLFEKIDSSDPSARCRPTFFDVIVDLLFRLMKNIVCVDIVPIESSSTKYPVQTPACLWLASLLDLRIHGNRGLTTQVSLLCECSLHLISCRSVTELIPNLGLAASLRRCSRTRYSPATRLLS